MGAGAPGDNVFVERLWRSLKCEEAYLRAYNRVGEARASIGRRELTKRCAYEKPSERRAREAAEAVRRARKPAQREGLPPMPKSRTGSR